MIRAKSMLFITLLLIFPLMFSCVSLNMKSAKIIKGNMKYKRNAAFYMFPVKLKAFNFYEGKQIAYIINKKLLFSLKQIDGVTLHSERKKGDIEILPELIIKPFESNYTEKNFYMIVIKILSKEGLVAEFRCQYNGPLSIFDANVQDGMIKKLKNDFKKAFR